MLLVASYYFYMCWEPIYLILILITTLINYYCGIKISETESPSRRKYYLSLAVASTLGILFFYKYFNFFNENFRHIFSHYNLFYGVPAFRVLLPIGISFYIFQALSYSIDVYRKDKEPEKHLGIFALYVSFFPQLVAGPIERSTHLLPQFYRENDFDYQRVSDGINLILWGYFKKLVIADRLSIYVAAAYNNQMSHSGLTLFVATLFFSVQIYCDFSGYSDIAIGCAKIMGYDLMENFRRPYLSASVREFWRRWHISLSSWFKDYLYIPLGGNRVIMWRWHYNIFVVFLLSGLWHGANWTFVIWGALHGFYLIFSLWSKDYREKIAAYINLTQRPVLHRNLKIVTTFSLLIFSWIFFRANSINDAFDIINKILTFRGPLFMASNLVSSAFAFCFLMVVELKQEFFPGRLLLLNHSNEVIRDFSCAVLVIIILLLGVLYQFAFNK